MNFCGYSWTLLVLAEPAAQLGSHLSKLFPDVVQADCCPIRLQSLFINYTVFSVLDAKARWKIYWWLGWQVLSDLPQSFNIRRHSAFSRCSFFIMLFFEPQWWEGREFVLYIKQEPRDDKDAGGLSEFIGREENADKEGGSAFPEVSDNFGQCMKVQDHSYDDFAPLWSLLDQDARNRLFDTQRLHGSDVARDAAALKTRTLLQSRPCQPSELKVCEGLSFVLTSPEILDWTPIEGLVIRHSFRCVSSAVTFCLSSSSFLALPVSASRS
jgi:hypothetical protein